MLKHAQNADSPQGSWAGAWLLGEAGNTGAFLLAKCDSHPRPPTTGDLPDIVSIANESWRSPVPQNTGSCPLATAASRPSRRFDLVL